jgi:hypothetical protein
LTRLFFVFVGSTTFCGFLFSFNKNLNIFYSFTNNFIYLLITSQLITMKNISPFFIFQAALLITINNLQIDDSLLCTKIVYIVSDAPKHHSLDVSSFQNTNIINVAFSFTNPNVFSTTFVMASFSKYYSTSEINSTSFFGKKPEDYSGIMDLRSMQLGETQYINLINTASNYH